MLASSCPGFVCLVEKTSPYTVPLLSSAKSPMAVAGIFLKTGMLNNASNPEHLCKVLSKNRAPDSQDVGMQYHVAIMPCCDKTLEDGRSDFT